MFNLFKKDLIVGWPILLGIILLIPFIATIAILAMIDDFGGLIPAIFGLLCFGLSIAGSFVFIGVDATYDADRQFVSLPLKRSKIVLARYFSAWISLTFNFSLIILTCLGAIYFFNQSDPLLDRILTWRGLLVPYLLLICILSYMLPFIFKFSANKGVFIAVATQVILMLVHPMCHFLSKLFPEIFEFDFNRVLQKWQTAFIWFGQLSTGLFYCVIMLLIVGSIVISIGLSIRFFNHRDI